MGKTDDLLETIKRDMRAKMKELQPAVDEYRKIENALKRLEAKKPGRKTQTDVAA